MERLQYADFFKESDATESETVNNEMSADELFLTVRSNDTVNLTVYGITDDAVDVSDNWIVMRVMNMQTYEMADSIDAAGQWGVPLGAVKHIKIDNGGGTVTAFGIFGNK